MLLCISLRVTEQHWLQDSHQTKNGVTKRMFRKAKVICKRVFVATLACLLLMSASIMCSCSSKEPATPATQTLSTETPSISETGVSDDYVSEQGSDPKQDDDKLSNEEFTKNLEMRFSMLRSVAIDAVDMKYDSVFDTMRSELYRGFFTSPYHGGLQSYSFSANDMHCAYWGNDEGLDLSAVIVWPDVTEADYDANKETLFTDGGARVTAVRRYGKAYVFYGLYSPDPPGTIDGEFTFYVQSDDDADTSYKVICMASGSVFAENAEVTKLSSGVQTETWKTDAYKGVKAPIPSKWYYTAYDVNDPFWAKPMPSREASVSK